MNSRDRFITTINGGEPDRPPVFANFTPQVAEKMSKHLGVPYEEPLDSMLSTRISHTDLLLKLGNDAVGTASIAPLSAPTVKDENGLLTNEYGMVFKETDLYNEFYKFPLENADSEADIDNYKFPDPFAEGRYNDADYKVSTFKKDYGVIADLETAIFETSWYLTGMEKFFMDMMLQPPYFNKLLDKVMNTHLEMGKELIRRGADMVWAGDDFGGQDSLLMSPDQWREIFKPRMKYMFEEFRKVNPDVKIAWHTCGSVVDIIPDLIDIGLDILNPIQPLAKYMTPEFLKKEYGKDLIFFGGIDVQELMPNGTPQQIKDEVKRRVEILGKGGGYILAPAHNIQDDTSVENVMAFFDAVHEL
ncbi:MAG: uroporphyrinogen decarboxylase family protein [Bacteroidota bacterium]